MKLIRSLLLTIILCVCFSQAALAYNYTDYDSYSYPEWGILLHESPSEGEMPLHVKMYVQEGNQNLKNFKNTFWFWNKDHNITVGSSFYLSNCTETDALPDGRMFSFSTYILPGEYSFAGTGDASGNETIGCIAVLNTKNVLEENISMSDGEIVSVNEPGYIVYALYGTYDWCHEHKDELTEWILENDKDYFEEKNTQIVEEVPETDEEEIVSEEESENVEIEVTVSPAETPKVEQKKRMSPVIMVALIILGVAGFVLFFLRRRI